MESGLLVEATEELLDHYRALLIVDPFFRIKVEISEGDYVSACAPDGKTPLTWILKLNPGRHLDIEDVQYSVIEALLKVLFHSLDVTDPSKMTEAKDGLVSRLATAITNLPLQIDEQDEPETNDKE